MLDLAESVVQGALGARAAAARPQGTGGGAIEPFEASGDVQERDLFGGESQRVASSASRVALDQAPLGEHREFRSSAICAAVRAGPSAATCSARRLMATRAVSVERLNISTVTCPVRTSPSSVRCLTAIVAVRGSGLARENRDGHLDRR